MGRKPLSWFDWLHDCNMFPQLHLRTPPSKIKYSSKIRVIIYILKKLKLYLRGFGYIYINTCLNLNKVLLSLPKLVEHFYYVSAIPTTIYFTFHVSERLNENHICFSVPRKYDANFVYNPLPKIQSASTLKSFSLQSNSTTMPNFRKIK